MSKSPTFRVKIPFWEGQFKCEIYNVNRELVFPKENVDIMDVIPKGSDVKIMLQCGGIWFAGGKFGITWKPYQIIVKPKQQLTPGVCHMVISDSELKVKSEEPAKCGANQPCSGLSWCALAPVGTDASIALRHWVRKINLRVNPCTISQQHPLYQIGNCPGRRPRIRRCGVPRSADRADWQVPVRYPIPAFLPSKEASGSRRNPALRRQT